MSRKNLNEISETQDLDLLIEQYAANKAEMDSYKKSCDAENTIIKNLMMSDSSLLGDDGKYSKTTGNYVAVITIKERKTMDEVKLLEVIKSSGVEGIVKTKEYVDLEELESAIYAGSISRDVLLKIDTCREVKEIPELKVTKRKNV